MLGAIYYVDASSESTRFCYDDARGSPQRARWDELDPAMVRSLPHERGFVEPERGDLVVIPAGWLRHWVPPIAESGSVRTVVVLNMVCM